MCSSVGAIERVSRKCLRHAPLLHTTARVLCIYHGRRDSIYRALAPIRRLITQKEIRKKNHAWRFNMFENYSINIRCLRRATIQFDDRIKLDNTRFVSRESSEYSHNPSALQLTSRLQRCRRREAYTGKYPCAAGYSSGGITPIIGRDLKGSIFFLLDTRYVTAIRGTVKPLCVRVV